MVQTINRFGESLLLINILVLLRMSVKYVIQLLLLKVSLNCDKNYRTDKLYKNNANMFMNVHLGMNYKKKHNSTR